jgi:hypothetical protein
MNVNARVSVGRAEIVKSRAKPRDLPRVIASKSEF